MLGDGQATLMANFLLAAGAPFTVFSGATLLYHWRTAEAWREGRSDAFRLVALLFGLSVLGACAGLAGGLSRETAVGDVIPAVFALLGGAALYLFGIDTSRGTTVAITGACLATALFFAFTLGSQIRYRYDEFVDLRDRCMSVYTNADVLANHAAKTAFSKHFGSTCGNVLFWKLPEQTSD